MTSMQMLLLGIALAAAPSAAHAVDGQYVRAFIKASDSPVARVQKVVKGMEDFTPLGKMVKDGRIKSPYDCLPEHRSICFDVLHGQGVEDDEAIQEWGEWRDAFPAEELPAFVENHVAEATSRGFNLLTNEELTAGR